MVEVQVVGAEACCGEEKEEVKEEEVVDEEQKEEEEEPVWKGWLRRYVQLEPSSPDARELAGRLFVALGGYRVGPLPSTAALSSSPTSRRRQQRSVAMALSEVVERMSSANGAHKSRVQAVLGIGWRQVLSPSGRKRCFEYFALADGQPVSTAEFQRRYMREIVGAEEEEEEEGGCDDSDEGDAASDSVDSAEEVEEVEEGEGDGEGSTADEEDQAEAEGDTEQKEEEEEEEEHEPEVERQEEPCEGADESLPNPPASPLAAAASPSRESCADGGGEAPLFDPEAVARALGSPLQRVLRTPQRARTSVDARPKAEVEQTRRAKQELMRKVREAATEYVEARNSLHRGE